MVTEFHDNFLIEKIGCQTTQTFSFFFQKIFRPARFKESLLTAPKGDTKQGPK